MPVPWTQMVHLMPSILELSRELLKRSRVPPETASPVALAGPPAIAALEARIKALEENERGQAELVTRIADQLAQLTTAVTALHRLTRALAAALGVTAVIAVVALWLEMR